LRSRGCQYRILDEHKEPLISNFFITNEKCKIQELEEKEYRGDFAIENIATGEIEVIDVIIAASLATIYDKCYSGMGMLRTRQR
jgi:hypothetical protein